MPSFLIQIFGSLPFSLFEVSIAIIPFNLWIFHFSFFFLPLIFLFVDLLFQERFFALFSFIHCFHLLRISQIFLVRLLCVTKIQERTLSFLSFPFVHMSISFLFLRVDTKNTIHVWVTSREREREREWESIRRKWGDKKEEKSERRRARERGWKREESGAKKRKGENRSEETFFKHFKMQMIPNQESGSKIAVNDYCICRWVTQWLSSKTRWVDQTLSLSLSLLSRTHPHSGSHTKCFS